MKKGDKIRITAGERTVMARRSMFVFFDGPLSVAGTTLFSNTALMLKDDGRWRDAISGAMVEVATRTSTVAEHRMSIAA
jgi:hypothetical protein